jgi:hypothetical protein
MSDKAERLCAVGLLATLVLGAAASGAPVKARQSPPSPDGAKRLEGREPAATIRGRRRTVTRGSAARRAGARERRDASQQHDE